MVGNGDGDKPMESTDDGARHKLFGPWDRDVFIIVRSEHSDNGRSNTWMRSKVRDAAKEGKSGSKTVTIRSDDQYNDDGGEYNDSITTVCFAPKDFRSSPGKGQTAIFIPNGHSVQVSCVAGSMSRQRLTIADSSDKTYAQFDDLRKNPDNGVSKRPMTSGGKRTVTLGPYDAHTWLVATYEGGWNANITVGHTGSQIVYTVGGEDRGDETFHDLLATFILSPV
ncbi:hypothetical protein EXIGLDRAFT_109674 [Exidia glandulosa HHB12029]|uniref:Uncharacterized protein n=1 Tax=Exidia glandulosa HHB12029 TaxID=1314781 RepID=A0A165GQK8_EXIGL|nr:hypothetical protein EXIGLDRAFT_109674 [Exidia glandulosa HHB12029]